MSRYVPWQQRHGIGIPQEGRECDPSFRLEEHIAEAKRAMGPERWAQLNAEWDACRGRELEVRS